MNSENREKTLPAIVDDFINCIVKKVGRSKKVRREVGQELTDHFTDALHEFQTETERQQVAEHLISQFGDPQMLACLIKRSKKRCRPMWWKITRRTLAVMGIIIAYLVINFAINYLPQPMPEFSRQTTYLENPPIGKDGMIDYAGWLNQQNSRGVTPENNMLTAFLQIAGTEKILSDQYIPKKFAAEYLKIIGAEDAPKQGIFITSDIFAKKHNIPENDLFNDLTGGGERPWKKSESPLTAEYLDTNKKAMIELEKAIDRPMYYCPYLSDGPLFECMLPSLSKIREAARIFICRSNLELANGNLSAAWKDVITVRKLGLHLMAKKGRYRTFIEQLVGIAINNVANRQANLILASNNLTLSQAKTFLQQWENLAPDDVSANDNILGERIMCLDFALRQSQGRIPNTLAEQLEASGSGMDGLYKARFNATAMMKTFNEFYDEFEYNGDRILSGSVPVEDNAAKYKASLSEYLLGLIAPQPFQNRIIGRLLVHQFIPAVQTVFLVIKQENTEYGMLKLGFALRIYQLENGKYPEKLSDLPTKLLREYNISLTDPFSGAQYKYSRTKDGFKIYSFGRDYTDNGGKENYNNNPDMVVDVPCSTPENKK